MEELFLMDYEKNAIEVLRILCGNSGFVVADSGGKDSSVLPHIAMKSGCKFEVVHNLTTVDAPETVYFIREKFKKMHKLGIKAEIIKPKESMWQLIIRKKTPPTRLIRYCCSELKENYGAGRKIVTGVRKAESINRSKNQGVITFPKPHKNVRDAVDGENFHSTQKGGVIILNMDNDEKRKMVEDCYRTQKILINPLVDWDDEFLLWYIKHENIQVNPLYECGFRRIGCIGCPMAGRRQRLFEFSRYPLYKQAYIKAFEKMLKAREQAGLENKCGWTDAESVFRWWMEDKTDPNQITLDNWLYEINAD